MRAIIALAALLPGSALAQSSVHDFSLGGGASVISEECIRLTIDHPRQTGSAWYQQPIDLSQPFEMRMSLVLGTKDEQGADGIVFVFHPEPATGWQGEGMGFAGLSPSLGIEFDTYQNHHLDDPPADHVAIMLNGDSFHDAGAIHVPNLEDGRRHPLHIAWSPSGQLEVTLDGQRRAVLSGKHVLDTFGGATKVYWGMTAATGRLSNTQDVCIEALKILSHSEPQTPTGPLRQPT